MNVRFSGIERLPSESARRPLRVVSGRRDALASTPGRHVTNITLLNTRIPTRLALRANLAALLLRSRTLYLLNLTEWIRSR